MLKWIERRLAYLLSWIVPDIRAMHYPAIPNRVIKVRLNKSRKFTGSVKLK